MNDAETATVMYTLATALSVCADIETHANAEPGTPAAEDSFLFGCADNLRDQVEACLRMLGMAASNRIKDAETRRELPT